MYSIPVTCQGEDEKRAHAPFVSGEVEIGGHSSKPLVFMLDTGADQTAVSQHDLRLPRAIYEMGTREITHGVGGAWPARRFINEATIFVPAEDEDGTDVLLELPLPKVSVLAPYADQTDLENPQEEFRVAPTDRRLQTGRFERGKAGNPLLGRDVIYAAEAELHYDPRGESAVNVPSVAPQIKVVES